MYKNRDSFQQEFEATERSGSPCLLVLFDGRFCSVFFYAHSSDVYLSLSNSFYSLHLEQLASFGPVAASCLVVSLSASVSLSLPPSPPSLSLSHSLSLSFLFARFVVLPGPSPAACSSPATLLAHPFHRNSPFLTVCSRLPRAFQTSPSSPPCSVKARGKERYLPPSLVLLPPLFFSLLLRFVLFPLSVPP